MISADVKANVKQQEVKEQDICILSIVMRSTFKT